MRIFFLCSSSFIPDSYRVRHYATSLPGCLRGGPLIPIAFLWRMYSGKLLRISTRFVGARHAVPLSLSKNPFCLVCSDDFSRHAASRVTTKVVTTNLALQSFSTGSPTIWRAGTLQGRPPPRIIDCFKVRQTSVEIRHKVKKDASVSN